MLISKLSAKPRLIAVIPARGGSKRVPRKNIRMLGGCPLIAWTIEAAKRSGVFCDVIVSTDDTEIAEIAVAHGATVPFLRPKYLSSDTADSLSVLRHALEWHSSNCDEVQGVVLLQPTSPFRSVISIREAVSEYTTHEFLQTLVSVSPAKSHPAWCFRKSGNGMEPYLGWDSFYVRSQDLPLAYAVNGAIYIIPPSHVRSNSPIFSEKTLYYIMENERESIDIDTEHDWSMAVFLASQINKV